GVRGREHRHDRTCRVGADHLRSVAAYVRRPVAGLLFRGARSDPVEPPGPGRGEPVPVGDLLHERSPEGGRAGVHRSADQGPRLLRSDRQPGGAVRALLSRRGVSPELARAPPRPAVYRLQRPAEAETVAGAIPRALQAIVVHGSLPRRQCSMRSSATIVRQYTRPMIGNVRVLAHKMLTASSAVHACRIFSTRSTGDRAAFGTLVDRYEEPVRRVARAVLRG